MKDKNIKPLPILSLSNVKKNTGDNILFIDVEVYKSEIKILEYNDRDSARHFINIILGLDVHYEGTYYINGINIFRLTNKEKELEIGGSVFFTSNKYGLIPELNVIDNILLQLRWVMKLKKINRKKILSVLNGIGMLHLAYRHVWELSPYDILQSLLSIAIIKKSKIIIIDISQNHRDCNELNIDHFFHLVKENDISSLLIRKMDMGFTKNILSITNG